MYQNLQYRIYIFTAGLVLTVLAATSTFAQNLEGVRIEKLSSHPTNFGKTDITDVFKDDDFFNSAVNAAWRVARPGANKAVE